MHEAAESRLQMIHCVGQYGIGETTKDDRARLYWERYAIVGFGRASKHEADSGVVSS